MSGDRTSLDVAAKIVETELAVPFEVAEGPLFRQGDPAESMYVIGEGEVQVVARTVGDDVVPLGRLGPGGILGEMALLDQGVRSATAMAIVPTRGWRLSRGAFQMMRLTRRPASAVVLAHIARLICRRIRQRVADLVAAIDSAPAPVFAVTLDRDRDRWRPAGRPEIEPRTASLLPLLAPFNEAQRAVLLDAGTTWAVARGERIAVLGEPRADGLLVLRGAVVKSVAQGGRSERCGLSAPGRLVSAVALMDGGPAAMDAAAREATVVLAVTPDTVTALRARGDELAYRLEDVLMNELVHELRGLSGQVARLAAHGRLARRPSTPPAR